MRPAGAASVVRWGILGAGRIARDRFVPALRSLPRVELAAVASRDPARARALGPTRVHATYEALLDDPDLDAIYVATHNGLHCAQTLAAVQRGKHVLCEKPLARDASEAQAMVAAAQSAGRTLVEAFMYRYHPQIAAAQTLVGEGAIGELKTVEAAFSFALTKTDDVRLNADWGGGSLLDVGCYCVNACRVFLGQEPRVVLSTAAFDPVHGIDLCLHGVLDYGAGRFGLISCGFDAGLRNRILLNGTKGTIALDQAFLSWQQPPQLVLSRDGRVERREFGAVDVFALEIADFTAAVRGERLPMLGPDEGVRNARIMDELLRQARRGQR